MVGTTLAHSGFGLVTGDATGVDFWVARAFCAALKQLRLEESDYLSQISAGFMRRGSLFPLPGYRPGPRSRIKVKSHEGWIEDALSRSDAVVMVGGHRGALRIARRFIDSRKPVFPIPFTGGHSDEVFQEVLKTWTDNPVPGLTRNQFLSLALPWISGTGPLDNLLYGTLAERPDIFVSYHRADSAAVAGRLHRDLAEHFGVKRVFMDVQGIAPSQVWDKVIEDAIQGCKAGVVVIGNGWMRTLSSNTPPQSAGQRDFVRWEIGMLLKGEKAIAPVLIEGASLPGRSDLPEDLAPLLRFQAPPAVNNANWDAVVAQLIRQLESAIRGC
jgi:hypothetical protein